MRPIPGTIPAGTKVEVSSRFIKGRDAGTAGHKYNVTIIMRFRRSVQIDLISLLNITLGIASAGSTSIGSAIRWGDELAARPTSQIPNGKPDSPQQVVEFEPDVGRETVPDSRGLVSSPVSKAVNINLRPRRPIIEMATLAKGFPHWSSILIAINYVGNDYKSLTPRFSLVAVRVAVDVGKVGYQVLERQPYSMRLGNNATSDNKTEMTDVVDKKSCALELFVGILAAFVDLWTQRDRKSPSYYRGPEVDAICNLSPALQVRYPSIVCYNLALLVEFEECDLDPN
ncbi:hypothetical protein E6O75_ATG11300 [Venturia nashicola]|uniref:Uncharacterized protein n=1 Tax=Venturia nashicola TaxID=86259 RepID=A0A4Z1NFV1_9PEZI|nr:hypothetical protein E6O75_ATG11300 [Venturia nashicola]